MGTLGSFQSVFPLPPLLLCREGSQWVREAQELPRRAGGRPGRDRGTRWGPTGSLKGGWEACSALPAPGLPTRHGRGEEAPVGNILAPPEAGRRTLQAAGCLTLSRVHAGQWCGEERLGAVAPAPVVVCSREQLGGEGSSRLLRPPRPAEVRHAPQEEGCRPSRRPRSRGSRLTRHHPDPTGTSPGSRGRVRRAGGERCRAVHVDAGHPRRSHSPPRAQVHLYHGRRPQTPQGEPGSCTCLPAEPGWPGPQQAPEAGGRRPLDGERVPSSLQAHGAPQPTQAAGSPGPAAGASSQGRSPVLRRAGQARTPRPRRRSCVQEGTARLGASQRCGAV